MTFRVILLTVFILFSSLQVDAAQEFFPFIGEIKTDNVNVRAGQSANFERLCQLDSGNEVFVVGRNYNWYKIRLPKFAKIYISAKYIHLLNETNGGVIGNKVNIRAGAGSDYSVLGQVKAGEEVRIVEIGEKWHRIEPMDNIYGWIQEDLVAFKSKEIEKVLEEPKESAVVISAHAIPIEQKENIVQTTAKIQNTNVLSATGYLQPVKNIDEISYRLDVHGKTLYFLKGMNLMLDDFINYKVEIEGTINTNLKDQFKYPVFDVTKIQLVL